MALLTSPPQYIYAKIVGQFPYKSVNPSTNIPYNSYGYFLEFYQVYGVGSKRPLYGVKAVYEDEAEQIAILATVKDYGAYFCPTVNIGAEEMYFYAEFMGEQYRSIVDLTDDQSLRGGDYISFEKQE